MPLTLTLTSFFVFFFKNASTFTFFIFNFCHVAGDFCSSYKDAPLSPSVLIYWVSYCLNLSRDAEKCPFGERKGNALAKIGKSTNSAPPAEWEVQSWSWKCAWRVYFTIIPVCLWPEIQLCLFWDLPAKIQEKNGEFHLILEIQDIWEGFRQASQLSNHSDQTFGILNFFSVISCSLAKTLLKFMGVSSVPWTFPANILFFWTQLSA